MEKNTTILLILGILVTAALLFYDIYLGGIIGIIFIAIVMSMVIMQDTTGIPEVVAKLNEEGKGVVLTNTGNARAEKIHVLIIPNNIEFDVASLDVDAAYEHPLGAMVQEVKIKISYYNENGRLFSSTRKLSVFEEEPDLLKPLIPMFKWKK